MLRHPPCSTLFPTRRSSDLLHAHFGVAHRRGSIAVDRTKISLTVDEQVAKAPGLGHAHDGVVDGLISVDRKSTRLNSSHRCISYAVFCLKKKTSTRYMKSQQ